MSEMVEKLRNIALVGHGDSGKTSLAEAMLFKAGVITRQGRVEEGNTAMDFEPEEVKRQVSISTAFHQYNWQKVTTNLMDTPGDQNFFSDTKTCLIAADGVIMVVDAVDGVKVQAEQAWEYAEGFNLPVAIFINKLDRERANFDAAVNDISEAFEEPKPILVQLPIGTEADFNGIVDLITMKAYRYDASGKASATDIPSDMEDAVEEARENLVENVAEADDELLERYLEGEELSPEELSAALRKGTVTRSFTPVLCGAATAGMGADLLMDFVAGYMPSPQDHGPKIGKAPDGSELSREPDPDAPFSAFVFKTVADPYAGRLSIFRVVSGTLSGDGTFYNVNKDTRERYSQMLKLVGKKQEPLKAGGPGTIAAVAKLKETVTGDTLCDEANKIQYDFPPPPDAVIAFAVGAKNKGDEDKLFSSLSKMLEEDAGLRLERNTETRQILLSGMGQVHIEATTERLRRKYNVEVDLSIPKVAYKETIKKHVRVQGKHKKQTGGHGQYGDCWIEMEPLPRGEGFVFEDAIVGGVIPKTYIPAVEKGIIEAAEKGVVAGFPCVDFKVRLVDGSFHAVDSSEMAFKVAGSLAFKKAVEQANPVLLEPIMEITIITPDEYMGDIMGDLNGKRGRVLGMDSKGRNQVIKAYVPQAEFLTYAPDLRSMTGGRGMFTMKFSHYDEVPAQLAEKIIEAIKKQQEE